MPLSCLHCDARLTDGEVAGGWCETCGKRLPPSVAAHRGGEGRAAAPPPAGPASPASGYSRLPAYPSAPDQTSELPPPKTPMNECLAGVIAGVLLAGAGCVLAGCDLGAVLLGLLLGGMIGALDGLLVAKLSGKTGTTVSFGNVLWALPRVLLWTLIWPVIPLLIMTMALPRGPVGVKQRFFESLDKWDQGGD